MADEPHLAIDVDFDGEELQEAATEAKDQGFDYFHIYMEGYSESGYETPTISLSLLGQGSDYRDAYEPTGVYYVGTMELDDA